MAPLQLDVVEAEERDEAKPVKKRKKVMNFGCIVLFWLEGGSGVNGISLMWGNGVGLVWGLYYPFSVGLMVNGLMVWGV